MEDTYKISEGVKKLEEADKLVFKMPESELKEKLGQLCEILSSNDRDKFFEHVDKCMEKEGISQEDVQEHIYRRLNPTLFPDKLEN